MSDAVFSALTNTGIYRPAHDELAFAADGILVSTHKILRADADLYASFKNYCGTVGEPGSGEARWELMRLAAAHMEHELHIIGPALPTETT